MSIFFRIVSGILVCLICTVCSCTGGISSAIKEKPDKLFPLLKSGKADEFVKTMSTLDKSEQFNEANCRKEFLEAIERGKSMGIDWKQTTVNTSTETNPGLRVTFETEEKPYEIWFAFDPMERIKQKPVWYVLGPVPHYSLLRIKNAYNGQHSGGISGGQACVLPDMQSMVLGYIRGGDGLKTFDCISLQSETLTLDGGNLPVMSPDGKKVIYMARSGSPLTYHIVNMNGDRYDLGIQARVNFPRGCIWSPDSRRCMIALSNREMGILDTDAWTLKKVQSNRKPRKEYLEFQEKAMRWLPNGQQFYIPSSGKLAMFLGITDFTRKSVPGVIISFTQNRMYQLFHDQDIRDYKLPIVSSDGKWVAGSRKDESAQLEHLLIARTDGSRLVLLLSVPKGPLRTLFPMSFSPGDRYLGYVRRIAPEGFYIVSLDGKEHFRIAHAKTVKTYYYTTWNENEDFLYIEKNGYNVTGAKSRWFPAYPLKGYLVTSPLTYPSGWLPHPRWDIMRHFYGTSILEPKPDGLNVMYKSGKIDKIERHIEFSNDAYLESERSVFRELKPEYEELEGIEIIEETISPKKLSNQRVLGKTG